MAAGNSNYARLLLAKQTNDVASYKSVKFAWVRDFKERVLNGEEGKDVVLYIVDALHEGEDGFVLKQGETVCLEEEGVEENTHKVCRPWGEVKSGKVPSNKLSVKEREKWTCEDVCQYIIKPLNATYAKKLEEEDASLVRKLSVIYLSS